MANNLTLFFHNKTYICEVMENDIDFNTFLASKKIDPDQFKKSEPDLFEKLASVFIKMHPLSFTAQKLSMINPLRRKYLLEDKIEEGAAKPKIKFKPKIR